MNVPPDEPWAFLNGQFVPGSLAKLPLFDAGLVQGAAVTDFVRTFKQQLYLLDKHLKRFRISCQLADIPLELKDRELAQNRHRADCEKQPTSA